MRRCLECCGSRFEGETCPNCGMVGEIIRPVSMGEGNTPLYQSAIWENVLIKDERQNPTGTFKDRQAVAIVQRALEEGHRDIVVASTGNTAAACAAYAVRAGIELWAFLPHRHRHRAFDAHIEITEATYDQTKVVAREFAEERGYFYAAGMDYVGAMAQIAYEILDDLGRMPDWYVQAVSGGVGPVGVCQGFQERTGKMPRVLVAQPDGCAPMVRSVEKGLEEVDAIEEHTTYAMTLGTGNPAEAYRFLRRAGATFMSVSDEETWLAVRAATRREGILMEPAAGVAFAALEKALGMGIVSPDELVVINCSGR